MKVSKSVTNQEISLNKVLFQKCKLGGGGGGRGESGEYIPQISRVDMYMYFTISYTHISGNIFYNKLVQFIFCYIFTIMTIPLYLPILNSILLSDSFEHWLKLSDFHILKFDNLTYLLKTCLTVPLFVYMGLH